MHVKIKYIYIVAILLVLFVPRVVLAKTTTDQFEAIFIKNYSYVDSKGKHANFEHFIRTSDKTTAYCIEPGVSLSSLSYKGYYDLPLSELGSKANISKNKLEKIALYAYFGYDYKGRHKGDDWIVATQTLIWKELGRSLEFTSGYHPENPQKYIIQTPKEIQEHMKEIKEYVDSYLKQPDFKTFSAVIPFNTSYNFGKLNGFEVKNCENCIYQVQNKELIVTPTFNKSGKIFLEKRANSYDEELVIYTSNNGQNVLVAGNLDPQKLEINFSVISGKLKLFKYDADSQICQAQENGSLKGSVYKLYKMDHTWVSDLLIGEDCSASIENLELGNYYLKEEIPGLNYELDPNVYYFSITKEVLTKEIIVYDKIYLGQVEIKKYDTDTKSCNSNSGTAYLNGAVYGIYTKEDKLVDQLIIDKNCKSLSKKNLLLGEYYLQEMKAPVGYKLDQTKYFFSITKENADSLVYLTVYDEVYKTKLIINKNFWYLNSVLPEKEAVFEIYDKKNLKMITRVYANENGYSEIELPYGEYIIRQVKGKLGYRLLDDIVFVVDKNTEKQTNMNLINHPFRGTLEFHKTDLATGKLLKNVLIEVYNEKDELIFSGPTDENGQIVIKELPYGKYYILEKKALNDYHLFKERIYFSITEDKQVVPISLENEKIVKVPNTGKFAFKLNFIFPLFFLIVGIGLVEHGKKI